jgi:hypothetical protein
MRSFLLAVAVVALSGCISTGTRVGLPEPLAPAEAAFDGPPVDALGCVEGGAHSVYNAQYFGQKFKPVPDPWVAADVSGDVGRAMLDTQGVPVTGPVVGIYHPYIRCDTWSWLGVPQPGPLEMGFVAIRVEPPPFDDGTIEAQYLLDVLSTNSEELRAMLAAAGFHATKGTGLFNDGVVLHTVFDDEEHGVYDTYATMEALGPKREGPVRLWMTLPREDELYHPVAVDFVDSGGSHFAAQGEAAFTHTRTNDHPPLGGFFGWTSAVAYKDFDRSVALGPHPAVGLEEGWRH